MLGIGLLWNKQLAVGMIKGTFILPVVLELLAEFANSHHDAVRQIG